MDYVLGTSAASRFNQNVKVRLDHPWVSSDQGSSRIESAFERLRKIFEKLRSDSKSFDPIRSDARSQSDENQMRDRNLTKPSLARASPSQEAFVQS